MFDPRHFLLFFAAALLLAITPGPGIFYVLARSLAGGRPEGMLSSFGTFVGGLFHVLAAALGVSAILAASAAAFHTVKYAGAAYLVWLGIHSLVDAVRGARSSRVHVSRVDVATAYRRGLLSNLGNPKMALFFTSLLPQFAPHPASFLHLFGLGLLFCATTLLWLCGYAAAVARLGDILRRSRVRRALDAITGTVLVAFGIRLAAER